MRYRFVAWDFDGTLADTLALSVSIFNTLAQRHHFRPVEDLSASRKLGLRAFLKHHRIPLLRLPILTREYMAAVRGQMGDIRLFPGIPELLHTLRQQSCRLGVLSSNTPENIQTCLSANGADTYFEWITGSSRLFGKAQSIRKVLRRERLAPQEFLYIGDEERDIEAARRAGVDVAAVSWGYHSPDLLRELSPTYLWHRPEDILTDLHISPPPCSPNLSPTR